MRLVVEGGLICGLPVKAGVRSPRIVEAEVAAERDAGVGDSVIGVEVVSGAGHRS